MSIKGRLVEVFPRRTWLPHAMVLQGLGRGRNLTASLLAWMGVDCDLVKRKKRKRGNRYKQKSYEARHHPPSYTNCAKHFVWSVGISQEPKEHFIGKERSAKILEVWLSVSFTRSTYLIKKPARLTLCIPVCFSTSLLFNPPASPYCFSTVLLFNRPASQPSLRMAYSIRDVDAITLRIQAVDSVVHIRLPLSMKYCYRFRDLGEQRVHLEFVFLSW